ncbi:MAG: hypothetical protein ACRD0J_06050, partial [Acidimicrobiales bacterium]
MSSGQVGQRRRRWPWLVVVVVLAAVAGYNPARHALAGWELHHLEAQWAAVPALDHSRLAVVARMDTLASASAGDQALVSRARAGLKAEEAGRLSTIEARLDGDVLLGSHLGGLRSAMESTVAKLRTSLLPGQYPGPFATKAWLAKVGSRITAARLAAGATGPAPTSYAQLTSADPTVARLGHYLDATTGDVLVLATSLGGSEVVNVDASTAHADSFALPSSVIVRGVLRRQGWLALVTVPVAASSSYAPGGGTLWAVSLARPDHAVRLATSVLAALPAAAPDAVWVESLTTRSRLGGGPAVSFREVDGAGRTLAGPATAPAGLVEGVGGPVPVAVGKWLAFPPPWPYATVPPPAFSPIGPPPPSTTTTTTTTTSTLPPGGSSGQPAGAGVKGLTLWDPATGQTRLLELGAAFPMAAAGQTLAWVDLGGRPNLHLTDVATGRTRTVAQPTGVIPGVPGDAAAFSPDGAYLALSSSAGMEVVDVATAVAK